MYQNNKMLDQLNKQFEEEFKDWHEEINSYCVNYPKVSGGYLVPVEVGIENAITSEPTPLGYAFNLNPAAPPDIEFKIFPSQIHVMRLSLSYKQIEQTMASKDYFKIYFEMILDKSVSLMIEKIGFSYNSCALAGTYLTYKRSGPLDRIFDYDVNHTGIEFRLLSDVAQIL